VPDTSHGCDCCDPEDAALICITFTGCFGDFVPGIVVQIDKSGMDTLYLTTDDAGRVCFTPPTNGEYIWSFAGDDFFALASGAFTFAGSGYTFVVGLSPASGRRCSCSSVCGPWPLPDTLTATSSRWGSCTLTYNPDRFGWEGSLSATGTGCDGEDATSLIGFFWLCGGGLTCSVSTCCKVVTVGYNAAFRFLHGDGSFRGDFGMFAEADPDCKLIDLEYTLTPPPGTTSATMILDECNTSETNAGPGDFAKTLGAWGYWAGDVVTVTE
jgi:hypothetical protein